METELRAWNSVPGPSSFPSAALSTKAAAGTASAQFAAKCLLQQEYLLTNRVHLLIRLGRSARRRQRHRAVKLNDAVVKGIAFLDEAAQPLGKLSKSLDVRRPPKALQLHALALGLRLHVRDLALLQGAADQEP